MTSHFHTCVCTFVCTCCGSVWCPVQCANYNMYVCVCLCTSTCAGMCHIQPITCLWYIHVDIPMHECKLDQVNILYYSGTSL